MKCPKCHYLSFDPEPRCKNCGHELFVEHDLPIRQETPDADPLDDLTLREPEPATRSRPAAVAPPASVPDSHDAPLSVFAAVPRRAESARPAPVTTELPLFVKGMGTAGPESAAVAPDEPLVKVPAEPRPPLAVRRKAPDTGSQKGRPHVPQRRPGPLERDLLDDLQRIERTEPREGGATRRDEAADRHAGAAKRLGAAAVDGAFLGGLAVAIVWVTLRWVDVPVDQITMDRTVLPILPTLVFLVLLGIGYLLLFTAASGQTLGKMVFGLRVIADEPAAGAGHQLSLRQALWRAVLTVPSVLALGAGFLPALMGDERAVHDRLAHTRVVRA